MYTVKIMENPETKRVVQCKNDKHTHILSLFFSSTHCVITKFSDATFTVPAATTTTTASIVFNLFNSMHSIFVRCTVYSIAHTALQFFHSFILCAVLCCPVCTFFSEHENFSRKKNENKWTATKKEKKSKLCTPSYIGYWFAINWV